MNFIDFILATSSSSSASILIQYWLDVVVFTFTFPFTQQWNLKTVYFEKFTRLCVCVVDVYVKKYTALYSVICMYVCI